MFKRKPVDPTPLDELIDSIIERVRDHDDPEQIATLVEQIVKLEKIRETTSRRISPDTLATIGANLLGIAMILKHEQFNVITSKAIGFVSKLK